MDSKTTLRQQKRSTRRSLTCEQQKQASLDLCQQLINRPEIKKSQAIASYISNDGEIDLAAFHQWCWKNGKSIYLPVLHPFSKGNLLFLKYEQNTIMHSNKYGIIEPKLSITLVRPINRLNIIIAPLVAFDEQANRLGMGGGYYDRTLMPIFTLPKANQPIILGVAHECQKTDIMDVQSWDIPMTKIITDQNCYPAHNKALGLAKETLRL